MAFSFVGLIRLEYYDYEQNGRHPRRPVLPTSPATAALPPRWPDTAPTRRADLVIRAHVRGHGRQHKCRYRYSRDRNRELPPPSQLPNTRTKDDNHPDGGEHIRPRGCMSVLRIYIYIYIYIYTYFVLRTIVNGRRKS